MVRVVENLGLAAVPRVVSQPVVVSTFHSYYWPPLTVARAISLREIT